MWQLSLFTFLRRKYTLLILFTIVFTALTLPNLVNQNLIGDEAVYIVEGDRYLHQLYSYYHNSGSPVLLKVITAIPYSVLPLNRDYVPYYNPIFTDVYKAADFTYIQNRSFAQTVIILARIPHLLLALLLGYSIFVFARWKFGLKVATVALVLYSFHATFLAHAATANLDIGVTAFCFWTAAAWYYYLENRRHKWLLVVTGILLGLAQATKISAILLYPLLILWYLYKRKEHPITDLVTVFGISGIALWAVYLFQIGPILTPGESTAGIESVYGSIPILKEYKSDITQLLYLPVYPLGAFLNNFSYQLSHSFFGHTNYLNGTFTNQGIWYYIPVVFTIKNSFILTFLVCLGGITVYRAKHENRQLLYFLWLWVLIVLIWSMQSKIQLGIRYALPMFPFLFIIAAWALAYWSRKLIKNRYANGAIAITLAVYILSTFRTGSNYFTYISEIYRGENPVDIVFDSDYDWGQNVYKMAEEQKSKNLYPLYFRSYGGANLGYEGIQNSADPSEALNAKLDGYYAFSHSALVKARTGDPTIFSYFYSKKPDYIINKTIYVYKVSFAKS